MKPATRQRVSFAVLIGLIVFLLGSLRHEAVGRDRAIASIQKTLRQTQQTVIDKLAEVLEETARAEQAALEAGQTPKVRIEDVLAQVKGLDQALIDQALQKAFKAIASTPVRAGPTGATGARGPAGPPGAAATATTAPGSTTTTSTRPATPTTTSSSTTTTCRLNLLGLVKAGCG